MTTTLVLTTNPDQFGSPYPTTDDLLAGLLVFIAICIVTTTRRR